MKLGEVSKLWPGIDWIQVANDIMENKIDALDASEIVKVSTLKFVRDVQVLLAKNRTQGKLSDLVSTSTTI